jgi:hypothetical protein
MATRPQTLGRGVKENHLQLPDFGEDDFQYHPCSFNIAGDTSPCGVDAYDLLPFLSIYNTILHVYWNGTA